MYRGKKLFSPFRVDGMTATDVFVHTGQLEGGEVGEDASKGVEVQEGIAPRSDMYFLKACSCWGTWGPQV